MSSINFVERINTLLKDHHQLQNLSGIKTLEKFDMDLDRTEINFKTVENDE